MVYAATGSPDTPTASGPSPSAWSAVFPSPSAAAATRRYGCGVSPRPSPLPAPDPSGPPEPRRQTAGHAEPVRRRHPRRHRRERPRFPPDWTVADFSAAHNFVATTRSVVSRGMRGKYARGGQKKTHHPIDIHRRITEMMRSGDQTSGLAPRTSKQFKLLGHKDRKFSFAFSKTKFFTTQKENI